MEFKKKIVRKPVAFNTQDAEQKELLIYALSLDNYSGYMKRLLKEDYKKQQALKELQKKMEGTMPLQFNNPSKGIRFNLADQSVNDNSSSATDSKSD